MNRSFFASPMMLMCIVAGFVGLPKPAKADPNYEVFGFSFSNTIGPVAGTVNGTLTLPIACLVTCKDQGAINVTVTDFPAGLDSAVGGPPFVFVPFQPATPILDSLIFGPNLFSVTSGKLTSDDFAVAYEAHKVGPNKNDRAIDLVLNTVGNYLIMGGLNSYVFNLDGVDAVTLTPTGITVAPEPNEWPTLGLGISAMAGLKFWRRPKLS
jgi:hypothetical protein